MNIAIIGGGFTGLTAAYRLTQQDHRVTVFEKEKTLGGLAYGFREPNWDWSLEFAYHHLFTNDTAIISLIGELGLSAKLLVKRPITATYINGTMYPLDSPSNLLTFTPLSLIDRIRTGLLVGGAKINPFWQPLEQYTAEQVAKLIGGQKAWDIMWKPLLSGKFGTLAPEINAAWLWARLHKRTPSLCYIEGGFQVLIEALAQAIKDQGGKIKTNTEVKTIHHTDKNCSVNGKAYDRVLLTIPTPLAEKLVPQLPNSFIAPLKKIKHLSAQILILSTKKPLLNNIYWLNINDRSFPFLAAVAHTNYMDTKQYGGEHLTYFGNYLPADHPFLRLSKEQILKKFTPYIERLHGATFSIKKSYLFTGPFAQPVHTKGYSHVAPKGPTPLSNIFLYNMDSIFPWDRGTNYAVDLGERAAREIL